MPDYKEMYLTMVRASEKAINTLVEAQRKCEELYLEGEEEKTEQENPWDMVISLLAQTAALW